MGWNTYIVNQTGQDVWCFWSTNPDGLAAGWDSTQGYKVPAGLSCSANRAGLCLFGLGAMFEPYPPAQPADSPGSPLGVPSLAGSVPPGGGGFIGTALNGIPVVWANWNSSHGNACCNWGFRLVTTVEAYQWEQPWLGPTTIWTYPPPVPQVAESQNWVTGSGMFAQYPASTSGCPSPVLGDSGH